MPELPDVEYMLRRLTLRILSKRIERVDIVDPNFVGFGSAGAHSRIKNTVITDVQRRGKFLVLFLDSGYILIFHMGMTGAIYLAAQTDVVEKWVRLRLGVEGRQEIRYRTVRKLGRIELAKGCDLDSIKILASLGVEPLSPACSPDFLQALAGAYRGTVKSLLMAQHKIAGIGNIYSDEILFHARVHPATQAGRLSEGQITRIHTVMGEVLREAARDLETLNLRRSWLLNYRSEADRCPRCRGRVRRIQIVGRSSYFCPRCQSPSGQRSARVRLV